MFATFLALVAKLLKLRLLDGLRLMRGVDTHAHATRYGVNVRERYADELARLQVAELIEFNGDYLRLTRRGVLLSNEVFAVFV